WTGRSSHWSRGVCGVLTFPTRSQTPSPNFATMPQSARRVFAVKPEQQETPLMSDSHTEMQNPKKNKTLPIPAGNDGWNDAASEAAERTIRGTLLKFADWRWT